MRALISIGTNSTRLLVVDGEEPVLHEARGTRIGEGLRERGPIAGGAAQRTLGAVREFVAIARAVPSGAVPTITRRSSPAAVGACTAGVGASEPSALRQNPSIRFWAASET